MRPSGTYDRTGPATCATSRVQTLASSAVRVGAICNQTVYTLDADDVAAFDLAGPTLNFALRLNSMYAVVI
jgi:hypothetical protein